MSRFLLTSLLGFASFAFAVPTVPTVTHTEKGMKLPAALALVKQQTKVAVVSELPTSPTVDLALRGATPWQALGSIAAQVNADVAPALDGKGLRLVPLPAGAKPVPTSYDGPFRFRVLRVSASRDLASGEGETNLSLEAAWLPSARPLFLDDQPQIVRVLDAAGKPLPLPDRAGSSASVDGRFAAQMEVKIPTVPRGGKLNLVEGKLNAVMPTSMVEFDFDKASLDVLAGSKPGGDQRRRDQKGVTCRIENISLGRDRWSVRMALDYPEGNRILESYEAGSMVVFNELRLEGGAGKGRRVLRPTASVANVTGSRRTVVTYHFTEGPGAPRSKPSAWQLHYTAPALIVDVPLRFSFKDVPLP